MTIIKIENSAFESLLFDLKNHLSDLTPAMIDVSAELVAGIDQSFINETDPNTGTPWQQLSETTISARTKRGYWPGKKLQQTGRLAASIVPAYGPAHAQAGTNVIYAGTMNFGASRGEFGATRAGAPVPFGDIPARPFIGISDETERNVIDVITEYLIS